MDQSESYIAESVLLVVETTTGIALFFTESRVVVAHLGSPGMGYQLGMMCGLVGAAIVGVAEDRRQAQVLQRLRSQPVARALLDSEKSYALPYVEVSSITFEKKMFGSLLRIFSRGKSHDFVVKRPKEIPNYASVLSQTLGREKVNG